MGNMRQKKKFGEDKEGRKIKGGTEEEFRFSAKVEIFHGACC